MSDESTLPNLVDRWRQAAEAAYRGDLDATMDIFAPDAVWEVQPLGISHRGAPAIRSFLEDWLASYENYEDDQEEGLDLGNGVVFVVSQLDARPGGSRGRVRERWSFTVVWVAGMVMRVTGRNDIDEARAAAERLAEERGQAMAENLDLVRSIYADWERGDYSSGDWAHPDIEFAVEGWLEPGTSTGVATMAQRSRELQDVWQDLRMKAVEYRELDEERILVFFTGTGRGKTSGVDVEQLRTPGANLFHIHDHLVRRLVLYFDRATALADLGLKE
jgi:ketosteroid isomerase-like protein